MLTAKQEQFCQLVAAGQLNNTEAYIEAYKPVSTKPASITPRAGRLLHASHIMARVQELREDTASATSWDRARFVGTLWQRSQAASQAGQHSASIRALELIGRACGLLVDRVEHSGSVGVEHYARLTMDQLEALARHSDSLPAMAEPGQAQPALPPGHVSEPVAEPVSL